MKPRAKHNRLLGEWWRADTPRNLTQDDLSFCPEAIIRDHVGRLVYCNGDWHDVVGWWTIIGGWFRGEYWHAYNRAVLKFTLEVCAVRDSHTFYSCLIVDYDKICNLDTIPLQEIQKWAEGKKLSAGKLGVEGNL